MRLRQRGPKDCQSGLQYVSNIGCYLPGTPGIPGNEVGSLTRLVFSHHAGEAGICLLDANYDDGSRVLACLCHHSCCICKIDIKSTRLVELDGTGVELPLGPP